MGRSPLGVFSLPPAVCGEAAPFGLADADSPLDGTSGARLNEDAVPRFEGPPLPAGILYSEYLRCRLSIEGQGSLDRPFFDYGTIQEKSEKSIPRKKATVHLTCSANFLRKFT